MTYLYCIVLNEEYTSYSESLYRHSPKLNSSSINTLRGFYNNFMKVSPWREIKIIKKINKTKKKTNFHNIFLRPWPRLRIFELSSNKLFWPLLKDLQKKGDLSTEDFPNTALLGEEEKNHRFSKLSYDKKPNINKVFRILV